MGRGERRRLTARFVTDERTGSERLALHVQGCRLGYVADKHLGWLAPLLKTDERGVVAFCGVEFFALQVTGGTRERDARGRFGPRPGASRRRDLSERSAAATA